MRNKDIVVIALRNLSAGKQMVKKIIFGMMFIVMILICFLTIVQSYFDYISEFNNNHVTDCYYYTEVKNQRIEDNAIGELLKHSDKTKEHYNAKEVSILCTIQLKDTEKELVAENTNLIIDGKTYNATYKYVNNPKIYQNIQWKNSEVPIALYQKELSVFADKIVSQYKGDYLVGEYPENPGEIMLDTYILEVYGIENQYESLLGTTVSIQYKNEDTQEIILKDYKLTGIFQGNLLSVRESEMTQDWHLEHIYVNLLPEDQLSFEILYGSIRYYFDDYIEYVKNYEHMESILKLDISNVYESGGIETRLTEKGMEYCLLYWVMDNIGKLMFVIAIVVGLIITFSVFYIFQFYRDRNANYFSMLKNIGMEKQDRRWIFSIEMSVVILVATLLGIYLSVVFLLLLNVIMKSILNFSVVMHIKTSAVAIIVSWLYLGLCLRIAMRKQ